MAKWEKLSSKIIYEHARITLVEDHVRLPGGQETDYLVFGESHNFPTIIVQRDDGKFLVTEEHAYPLNESLLQFPEGFPNKGEEMIDAGRRELLEETGYTAANMTEIGTPLFNHRRSTGRQYVLYATGITEGEKAAGDLEEGDITSHWFSEDEIWDMIAEGKIIQRNALTAWSIYQAYKRAQ